MKLPIALAAVVVCCAFAAPAAPQPVPRPVPRLVPAGDVTVDYAVQPRDHAPVQVRAEIQHGGSRLRIASQDLPTSFLVDRASETATILLPMLRLYATVGIARYDPEQTVLQQARFERHGSRRLAGLVCTDWSAASPRGQASACITEDGVILAGTASDARGSLGSLRATAVQYGPLSPLLFQRPDDFQNAGSIPVDGLGGFR